MKYLVALFLLASLGYASSPFSLESLHAVNITVLNKNKGLDAPFVATLKEEIITQLHNAGIQTNSKSFSNFLIKINTQHYQDKVFVHVNLSLVENARITRQKSIPTIAITYTKDDFFETSDFEADTKESVLFLLNEFIDQFKEENK